MFATTHSIFANGPIGKQLTRPFFDIVWGNMRLGFIPLWLHKIR